MGKIVEIGLFTFIRRTGWILRRIGMSKCRWAH